MDHLHHSDGSADPDVGAIHYARGVLQERSANWPYERTITTTRSPKKLSRTSSPTEQTSGYSRRVTYHVPTHHINLTGFGVATPDKQLKLQLERLYKLLARSDKYQKYREKQPVLTPQQVIAIEAAEAAEKKKAKKLGKEAKKEKDKTVWPEFLESAFWRALVRWPPMGRRKCMLHGVLRGRNELIQDSIYMDTGIRRDRKQVSSHLQVLKGHLHDQPDVLYYMTTKEDDKKKRRGAECSPARHLSHARGRRHFQRTASNSKYDFSPSASHLYPPFGSLQSNIARGININGNSSPPPYAVMDFTMLVDNDSQPVHYFTQLSSNGRLGDLHVTDNTSWRRQYPEFDFLRSHMNDWIENDRKVLVCDASIKVMTEVHPNADLSIIFKLHSQRDLSPFQSLECTTRFFDSGDIAPDPQFDGPNAHDLKEHRTPCDYMPASHSSSGHLIIAFGSKFWVNRMLKYQSLRHKDESCVSRSLLRLTATQDVYGIEPGTGKAQCIMTILWRFSQTRSSAEVGSMSWRAVSFGVPSSASAEKAEWLMVKEGPSNNHTSSHPEHDPHLQEMTAGHEEAATIANASDLHSPSSLTPEHDPHADALYQHLQSVSFPHTYIDHADPTQHIYPDKSHAHIYPQDNSRIAAYPDPHAQHTAYTPDHPQHPPPLHLDILAPMHPDLSASAPTTATDYSAHTLPLSQDAYTAANEFDFHGDHHIGIEETFDSTTHLSAYESFGSQVSGLDALASLDTDALAELGLVVTAAGELVALSGVDAQAHIEDSMCSEALGSSGACTGGAEAGTAHITSMGGRDSALEVACYSTKPAWHHANLIESLESAAEQFHAYVPQDDAQGSSLWPLQSPFREEAVEAGAGMERGESTEAWKERTGLDILEQMEREQKGGGFEME